MEKGIDIYNETVDRVMTKTPKWVDSRDMAVNALQKMNDFKITCMPALDENKKVAGSILMQDISKAGIM